MNEPILHAHGLSKAFGDVQALQDVSFSLSAGRVLGLAGHNGAGKSTLLNILSGVFPATSGTITIGGRPFRPSDYRDANCAGVFRIYQEPSVVDNLTVGENLTLANEGNLRRGGYLSPAKVNEETRSFLDSVDLDDLDPKAVTGSLSLAEKQILEIVRALYIARQRNVEIPVLLLDEPTSSLRFDQIDYLESHIDRIRNQAAIVLTTHRGTELLEWSDDIIVLRDGSAVAAAPADTFTVTSLAAHMAGEDGKVTHLSRSTSPTQYPVIVAREVLTPDLAAPLSLAVHAGEVVAIISDADDKSQIIRTVAGADVPRAGTVDVDGTTVATERDALEAGIRFVPADRGDEGLALGQSVKSNLTIVAIASEGKEHLARRPQEESDFAQSLVEKFLIKVSDIGIAAGSLSGGNQQKVLVARSLAGASRAIVLDRPTRGIDVGAKAEIYKLILEAADRGIAFLLASDEPEEVLPICDRLIVLRDGVVSREFDIHSDGTPTVGDIEAALAI